MDETHRKLARIGLAAAKRYGFALAGGYAVQAHGILTRPSEDVDLFTGWDRRNDFDAAISAVVKAYVENGYEVEVAQRFETFARLRIVDPNQPDRPQKVELAANWRSHSPIQMDLGPVLHLDDVVTGKMSALYTRAEPRDFLDVDAAIVSGGYSHEQLCELSAQADAGFDLRILRQVFGVLERYPDRRFAAYGVDPERIAQMRARFASWRNSLPVD